MGACSLGDEPDAELDQAPPQVYDEGGQHQPEVPRRLDWCGDVEIAGVHLGFAIRAGSRLGKGIRCEVLVAGITPRHSADATCDC